MPSSRRIIGAHKLSGVRRFKLSELAPDKDAAPAAPSAPRDASYEAGRAAGLREGYQEGLKAARAQAARDESGTMKSFCERASQLSAGLAEQIAAIEQSVADKVVDLAIELARQTVRHSLEVDRDAILQVVQDAIAALIDEHASFVLHLNPADAGVVRETLGASLDARHARIVPDPKIGPSSCRVVSAGAEVDATLETRWRCVLASIGRKLGSGTALSEAGSEGTTHGLRVIS